MTGLIDDEGGDRMSKKAREDDSTKEFKKAAKAMDNQPTKKEEKKIEKTTKHLPRMKKYRTA
jgi:hypothetical protein